LSEGVIGIDIMFFGLLKGVQDMNPRLSFVECSDTFSRAKAIKCNVELDVIKSAAEIAEIGMKEALNSVDEAVNGRLEMTLDEGNVISIEPSVHLPGVGGVRLEQMVIVTEDEHEVITKSKFDESLLC